MNERANSLPRATFDLHDLSCVRLEGLFGFRLELQMSIANCAARGSAGFVRRATTRTLRHLDLTRFCLYLSVHHLEHLLICNYILVSRVCCPIDVPFKQSTQSIFLPLGTKCLPSDVWLAMVCKGTPWCWGLICHGTRQSLEVHVPLGASDRRASNFRQVSQARQMQFLMI